MPVFEAPLFALFLGELVGVLRPLHVLVALPRRFLQPLVTLWIDILEIVQRLGQEHLVFVATGAGSLKLRVIDVDRRPVLSLLELGLAPAKIIRLKFSTRIRCDVYAGEQSFPETRFRSWRRIQIKHLEWLTVLSPCVIEC